MPASVDHGVDSCEVPARRDSNDRNALVGAGLGSPHEADYLEPLIVLGTIDVNRQTVRLSRQEAIEYLLRIAGQMDAAHTDAAQRHP
jgi:hypothetical protein